MAKISTDEKLRQVEEDIISFKAKLKAAEDYKKIKGEAQKAKIKAENARAEAEKVKTEAQKAKSQAENAKAEAEKVKTEAQKAKVKAENAKAEAEKVKTEAQKAKSQADNQQKEHLNKSNLAQTAKQKAEDEKTTLNGQYESISICGHSPAQACLNQVKQRNIARDTKKNKLNEDIKHKETEKNNANQKANEFAKEAKQQEEKIKAEAKKIEELIDEEGIIDFSSIEKKLEELLTEQKKLNIKINVENEVGKQEHPGQTIYGTATGNDNDNTSPDTDPGVSIETFFGNQQEFTYTI
ncbi:hypothetical protein I862_07525 [endosymbiont of Acanthamoeba sp. UWC8]|uniref:hypothetical protein n=1 Tax=endosymbiont of Acanthamoeba sp. UWC8 TaxID=86106 RepID=UPI0004D14D31|nr:hypothetical protein [endosymbiont of Acanthamoeba sp. UWC8]AIF82059.1 hypothetical protein I862_07525 [endosymbiont of Acanthamoeba sp. UWC8]